MTKQRSKSEPPSRASAREGDGIASLVLENVRCFARAEVRLDAPVTVIIGQNGSGKTTIAEAIASLAYGDEPRPERFPRRREGEAGGAIRLFDARGEALAAWVSGPNGERRDELPPGYLVFAYGQYRTLKPRAKPRPSLPMFANLGETGGPPVPENLADALRRPKTVTLFDFDEYLLRDLSTYLPLLASGNRAEAATWARLRESLPTLDPRLRDFAIVEQGGRRVAMVRCGGLHLTLAELSDGYRAMLSVVLDLAISYSQLFAHRDDPLAGQATVVIDEVDLNLHPRWQRRIIDQLTQLFPGTRFVLTTHSPAVVQSAIDRGHAVIALNDERGGGTIARPLKKGERHDLEGAEVDSVQEDARLFDTSRQSTKWEEEEAKAAALRKKVEAGMATAEDRERLLTILDEFQFQLAKEEERRGVGPLMSELARTQIAFLKSLNPQKRRPAKRASTKKTAPTKAASKAAAKKVTKKAAKQGAKRHGATPTKGRQGAR
ncbi:MAG TPA: AAA family ATPase [Polyangiaceae bacterium]|nr:AAA family ATPase [Polyangiaceae bacterium]